MQRNNTFLTEIMPNMKVKSVKYFGVIGSSAYWKKRFQVSNAKHLNLPGNKQKSKQANKQNFQGVDTSPLLCRLLFPLSQLSNSETVGNTENEVVQYVSDYYMSLLDIKR